MSGRQDAAAELTDWQLLSNMQGIRIGVRIGEQPSSKIAVDLHADASSVASFAKPLLLQVLSDKGALINDFQSWTVQAKGSEISLAGTLSTERPAAADERGRFAGLRKQPGQGAERQPRRTAGDAGEEVAGILSHGGGNGRRSEGRHAECEEPRFHPVVLR